MEAGVDVVEGGGDKRVLEPVDDDLRDVGAYLALAALRLATSGERSEKPERGDVWMHLWRKNSV